MSTETTDAQARALALAEQYVVKRAGPAYLLRSMAERDRHAATVQSIAELLESYAESERQAARVAALRDYKALAETWRISADNCRRTGADVERRLLLACADALDTLATEAAR